MRTFPFCRSMTVLSLALASVHVAPFAALHAQDSPSVWQPAPAQSAAPLRDVSCVVVDYADDLSRYDSADNGTNYRYGGRPFTLDYATDVDVDGDGRTDDDFVAYLAFSLEAPLSPAAWPASGYFPGVRNGKWYGGMAWQNANAPRDKHNVTAEHYVNPNHEGPFFDRRAEDFAIQGHTYTKSPDAAHRHHAVFVWKKEDFLNGGADFPVSFGADSRMGVFIARYWHGFEQGRFVVREGGRWFISEQWFTGPDWLRGTKWMTGKAYFCEPTETRWAPYEPQDHRIAFDPEAAEFRERDFKDLDAVGWYIAKDELTAYQSHIKWYTFEVRATVRRPERASETMAMVTVPAAEGVPAFHIGTTELPYRLWKRIYRYATRPIYTKEPGYLLLSNGDMGSMDTGNLPHVQDEPVTDLTVYDAAVACNALSEMEGRTPCYYVDEELKEVFRFQEMSTRAKWPEDVKRPLNPVCEPTGRPALYVRWDADGYRLPTPSEWAQAWRAGAQRVDDRSAWTPANAGDTTHPVGSKAANALGLYDLAGNAWEMLWVYGDRLEPDAAAEFVARDGAGVAGALGFRMVRREPGRTAPAAAQADEVAVRFEAGADVPAAPGKAVLDMVRITAGRFVRRDDGADISLSAFACARSEVTYAAWRRVYEWAVAHGYTFASDGDMGSMYWFDHPHDPSEPVTSVTWHDCMVWCNALSEMEGRTPCYYVDAERTKPYREAFVYRPLKVDAEVLGEAWYKRLPVNNYLRLNNVEPFIWVAWDADGYRLPTLAEWTYAALGGREYPVGLAEQAWDRSNSGGRTHPVGAKEPNGYGLLDAFGNVAERLWSVGSEAHDYYYDVRNPKGNWYDYEGLPERRHMLAKRGPFTAGGSWFTVAGLTATNMLPSTGYPDVGFRPVRCKAGTHPRDGNEKVERIVLDIAPEDFDPLRGACYRASLLRDGAHDATGLPRAGDVLWTFDAGAPVVSSPVVVDGVVYVGSGTGFHALGASDGAELWKVKVPGGVLSSACVAAGSVYFLGHDNRLYRVDAATGEVQWRFTCILPGTATDASPAVAYGTVFVNFGRRGIAGVSIDGAAEVWRCRETLPPAGLGSPALTSELLVQSGSGVHSTYGTSLRTERRVWSAVNRGHSCSTTAAISNGIAYSSSNSRPHLLAVETRTGKLRWSRPIEEEVPEQQRRACYCSVAAANDRVFVGTDSGALRAFGIEKGEPLWTFRAEGAVRGSPSVALKTNTLYFGSADGHVYALDAKTGDLLWKHRTGGAVTASPWPGDGAVYIASEDGKVRALGAAAP